MTTRRRIQKAKEERFIKSLEEARETLDSLIEQAERGSSRTLDTLEQFSDEMDKVYSQARRMEGGEC